MRFWVMAVSLGALSISAWSASASTTKNGITVRHSAPATSRSWIDRAALKGPLVYASVIDSGVGTIIIYDAHLHMVGELGGLSEPTGLAVDEQHNLYVADSSTTSVFEYARGQTTPSRVLTSGRYAEDVTVVPGGTVYVSEDDSSSGTGGDIAVYPPEATSPKSFLVVGSSQDYMDFERIASDAAGNVFEYVAPLSGSREIVEFAAGKNPDRPLPIVIPKTQVPGLATTPAGDLVVCFGSEIATFKVGKAQPFRTIGVPCGYTTLTTDGHQIVTERSSLFNRYLYPGGAQNGSVKAPAHEEFWAVAADGPASR